MQTEDANKRCEQKMRTEHTHTRQEGCGGVVVVEEGVCGLAVCAVPLDPAEEVLLEDQSAFCDSLKKAWRCLSERLFRTAARKWMRGWENNEL